jgi:hypothetical protein
MVSVSLEVMVGPGEVDVGRAIRLLIEARVGSIVHRYNLTLETTSFGIRVFSFARGKEGWSFVFPLARVGERLRLERVEGALLLPSTVAR